MDKVCQCSQCNHLNPPGSADCEKCGSPLRGSPVVAAAAGEIRVIVTDFDMPFWSMAGFIIKWAFAAIPAGFVLGILWWVVTTFLTVVMRPGTVLK